LLQANTVGEGALFFGHSSCVYLTRFNVVPQATLLGGKKNIFTLSICNYPVRETILCLLPAPTAVSAMNVTTT